MLGLVRLPNSLKRHCRAYIGKFLSFKWPLCSAKTSAPAWIKCLSGSKKLGSYFLERLKDEG
jgi:hypothetical protein